MKTLSESLRRVFDAPICWKGPLPNEAIAAVNGDRARLKPYLDALIECADSFEDWWLHPFGNYTKHARVEAALSKLRTLLEAP